MDESEIFPHLCFFRLYKTLGTSFNYKVGSHFYFLFWSFFSTHLRFLWVSDGLYVPTFSPCETNSWNYTISKFKRWLVATKVQFMTWWPHTNASHNECHTKNKRMLSRMIIWVLLLLKTNVCLGYNFPGGKKKNPNKFLIHILPKVELSRTVRVRKFKLKQ